MSLDKLTALAERFEVIDSTRAAMAQRPRASAPWYRVTNLDTDLAEVMIFDEIGGWGLTASDFVRDLRAITAKTISLHINSPGGLVFDAIAIYSALKSHVATVNVTVDGIAASAASFVAMAGDSIAIEKPAKIMIHDAGGMVWGNAADMRTMADLLDELSDTIAGIYTDRAGGTVESWRAAMGRETWYSAEQAVAAGLADRVAGDSKASAPEDRRTQLIRARARVRLEGAST